MLNKMPSCRHLRSYQQPLRVIFLFLLQSLILSAVVLILLFQEDSDVVPLCLQLDSKSITVGKAAIGNMLGGIGYFFGQSKISVPKNSNVSDLQFFYFFLFMQSNCLFQGHFTCYLIILVITVLCGIIPVYLCPNSLIMPQEHSRGYWLLVVDLLLSLS